MKKTITGFIFAVMAFALVFAACDPMEGSFKAIKEKARGGKPKVYVAGYYYENSAMHACYWVDGEGPFDLNGGVEAKAITVAGGKVYVAGTYGTSSSYSGCYWVDGARSDLTGSSDAVAIAYSNGNVYTAGIGRISATNYPSYWINRSLHPIYDSNFYSINSVVSGMALSGSDVYVLGTTHDNDEALRACYWKNESPTPVTFLKEYQEENEYRESSTCDMTIFNDTIYVAGVFRVGSRYYSYFYWKENSEPTVLSSDQGSVNGDTNGTDLAITVSKGKVYVAGSLIRAVGPGHTYYACYWVDGKDTVLADGYEAKSIAVLDNVVYVAGTYEDGYEQKACYWVNGERTILPGGNSSSQANAIVVAYE